MQTGAFIDEICHLHDCYITVLAKPVSENKVAIGWVWRKIWNKKHDFHYFITLFYSNSSNIMEKMAQRFSWEIS